MSVFVFVLVLKLIKLGVFVFVFVSCVMYLYLCLIFQLGVFVFVFVSCMMYLYLYLVKKYVFEPNPGKHQPYFEPRHPKGACADTKCPPVPQRDKQSALVFINTRC